MNNQRRRWTQLPLARMLLGSGPVTIAILIVLLSMPCVFAFDHTYAQYQTVLDKYVSNGRVNYEGLKADRAGLDSFIVVCCDVPFERYQAFTRSERLAFMINLYNAGTLQLMINHWPLESIQDIGGFFTSPWNKKVLRLFEHEVSLGQIEHDILRTDFKEPRIHFAIVCASVGCPILFSEAYNDLKITAQLAQAERHFLTQRPNENRFENGELFISPIFKWYREDFDGDEGVRTLLKIYYPEVTKDTRINYTEYDWSVNGLVLPANRVGVE